MNYNSFTVPELQMIARENGAYHVLRLKKKNEMIESLVLFDNAKRAQETLQRKKAEAEAAHRATRRVDGELRRQSAAELEAGIASLAYPYRFLRSGEYSRDITPLLEQTEAELAGLDIGDFPDQIAEYLWVHAGCNDEEPWLVLCRLRNGVYVFYRGECDYTGFDCQGMMRMYASRTVDTLLLNAMTMADYEKYIADTDGNSRGNRNRVEYARRQNTYDYSTDASSGEESHCSSDTETTN